MKDLVIRLFSLIVCYAFIIVHIIIDNGNVTVSIIILAVSLLFYFITPLMKQPLLNYMVIILILPLNSLAEIDLIYTLPLMAFNLMEGTLRLKEKNFSILICTTFIISVIITILKLIPLFSFLLLIAIIVACYLLNQHVQQLDFKKTLYEQLLVEFRKLKRQSVQQEEFVRAEERTKIARDMHDSVGHKLTTLLMQLEMHSIQNNTENLNEVKQLAKESLEETRFAVRQLKSSEITGIQSVIQLIRKLELESRLHIRFTLEKGILSLPISNNQSIVLYRVLQESLTNAMKHSHSREVEVTLGVDSLQQVQFEVKNKLLSEMPIINGFGLINMEERMKEINGELRIVRTEQHFILRGTFPLKSNAMDNL